MQSPEIGLTFALAGQGLFMGMVAITDAWRAYKRLQSETEACFGRDELIVHDSLISHP